jgi:hypothetical protein
LTFEKGYLLGYGNCFNAKIISVSNLVSLSYGAYYFNSKVGNSSVNIVMLLLAYNLSAPSYIYQICFANLLFQPMTWIDGYSFCRSISMDLVSIETDQELNSLAAHANKIGGNKYQGPEPVPRTLKDPIFCRVLETGSGKNPKFLKRVPEPVP